MKISIVDDVDDLANRGRIVEVEDGELVVDTCFICDNPPKIDSASCEMKYCCEEHQELHQPDEEEQPFPFVVKYRPDVGRYIVAARDIQRGEIIFTEDPLAIGPNHTSLPTCLECMRTVDGSYLCPKCNLPVCEEMCAYGEEHSKECEVFSKLEPKLSVDDYTKNSTIYWCITALRGLLLKESDPEKYDIIKRMMDHNVNHAKDVENWAQYRKNVVDFLIDRCRLKDVFTDEEILHVLGVLDVNSVAIHASPMYGNQANITNARPGHALFALTSLMSHNCISNSKTQIKSDYSCECRATSFIPSGEEITKQYVSALETTPMRRQKLKAGWYFDCKCQRCTDPTEHESFVSATRCLKCGEGTILALDPLNGDEDSEWKCDACGFATSLGAVQKLVQYFLTKLSDPYVYSSVEALEELLDKSVKLLHPQHYVVNLLRIKLNSNYVRLAHRMFKESEEYKNREFDIPTEVYMRRKELLDDIHRTIEIVEPGLTRRRGLSLFETATCHLQLGRQLFEADRFSKFDFVTLIQTEMESLKEAIECLKHSRDGTNEAHVNYQAQGALYEAECTLRVILQLKSKKDGKSTNSDQPKHSN